MTLLACVLTQRRPTPNTNMAHVFCYSSWWEDTFSILLVGTTCMKSSLLKSTQFCLDPAVGPTSLCLNAFSSVGQPSTRQTLLHWMMLGLLNHCYSNLDQKLATLVLFQVFHVRWHFKFILTMRRLQRDDRIMPSDFGFPTTRWHQAVSLPVAWSISHGQMDG